MLTTSPNGLALQSLDGSWETPARRPDPTKPPRASWVHRPERIMGPMVSDQRPFLHGHLACGDHVRPGQDFEL